MTSLAKTKTDRATVGADVHGEARLQRSDLWASWMPAEAATPGEPGEEMEGPLPILATPHEGQPQWFSRVLGILVVLCLVLAVVVWWRLLT